MFNSAPTPPTWMSQLSINYSFYNPNYCCNIPGYNNKTALSGEATCLGVWCDATIISNEWIRMSDIFPWEVRGVRWEEGGGRGSNLLYKQCVGVRGLRRESVAILSVEQCPAVASSVRAGLSWPGSLLLHLYMGWLAAGWQGSSLFHSYQEVVMNGSLQWMDHL